MSKQFTLGKNERLKSRKLIEQLFKEGKSFVIPPFRIYYKSPVVDNDKLAMDHLQFGIGVSTKNFKKAVDRNRIKRLAKEAYRLQKNGLQEKLKERNTRLNIFFIYTGKELPAYDEVYNKIGLVLVKLDKLVAA